MSTSYTFSGYAPAIAASALGLSLIYSFSPQIRNSISPSITPGKLIFSAVALATSTGCYIADWSHTHVFNPRWPPHAKFHNGQTMSMGLSLGLMTFYFTWRRKDTNLVAANDVFTAALLGSLYWITGLSGGLYPGALFVDPEFVEETGSRAPQIYGFTLFAGLAWLAYWLEMRRLTAQKA